MLQCQIDIGQRLGLDALCRIDDEQRPLAGGQTARHLVVEIDVARSVDEVELIFMTVLRLVVQAHGLGLDRDAALTLEIHIIEDLVLHLALRQRPRALYQTIRDRRFAVIDMGDNREITDVFILHAHFPFAYCYMWLLL